MEEGTLYKQEQYNSIGLKYQEVYSNDPDLIRFLKDWLHLLPDKAHILDCGSGTGKPVARTIVDTGYHVHGIDFSSNMIDLARKQVPEGTFELVSMLDYHPKAPFDGVVASLSLFERSREELITMSHKWFQWLKPGGYLLINMMAGEECDKYVPLTYDADGMYVHGSKWLFLGDMLQVGMFTRKGWRTLLEGAGFEIFRTEDAMFVPPAECYPEARYYIVGKKPEGGAT